MNHSKFVRRALILGVLAVLSGGASAQSDVKQGHQNVPDEAAAGGLIKGLFSSVKKVVSLDSAKKPSEQLAENKPQLDVPHATVVKPVDVDPAKTSKQLREEQRLAREAVKIAQNEVRESSRKARQLFKEARKQASIEAKMIREAKRADEARLEAERKAKEEAERLAKLEAERLAKLEAERLEKIKLDQERVAKEKAEAERLARLEAERLAKLEAERKAKELADQKRLAIEQAKKEALAQKAAEKLAREEAKRQAKEEKIRKEKLEAERKAKEEAERKAKEEAERKAKEEAELKAKLEADRKAKEEAELKAKLEAERKAKEEAELKAKLEADRKAKEEVELKAKLEADRKAKEEAELKLKEEADRKAREWAEKNAKAEAERVAANLSAIKAKETITYSQPQVNHSPVNYGAGTLTRASQSALQKATSKIELDPARMPLRNRVLGYTATESQIESLNARYRYDSSKMALMPKMISEVNLNITVRLVGDNLQIFKNSQDKKLVEEYLSYYPVHARVFSNYIKRVMNYKAGHTGGITVDQAIIEELTYNLAGTPVPSSTIVNAQDKYLYIVSRLTEADQLKFWNWVNTVKVGETIEVPSWIRLADVLYSN